MSTRGYKAYGPQGNHKGRLFRVFSSPKNNDSADVGGYGYDHDNTADNTVDVASLRHATSLNFQTNLNLQTRKRCYECLLFQEIQTERRIQREILSIGQQSSL